MSDLAGIFKRPFAEQLAAFRLRLGNRVPTRAWDDLVRGQHDRAFVVAGATKAELLADLADAVDRTISEGRTLDQFRADFRDIVERNGWHGWTGEGTKRGEAWRTRVIYQTNLRTSYMAGRHAQLIAGNFKFWVYRHGGSIEPRLQHLAWDGLVLPPDHPFWQKHFPPNDWGCSCRVFGARTLAGARRLGGDPSKVLQPGWNTPDPRTGTPPGIGKGWDYAPGASVSQTVSLAARLLERLPTDVGAPLGGVLASLIERAWPSWLAEAMTRKDARPGVVGTISADFAKTLAARGIEPRGAPVFVRPGLVAGQKAERYERQGKALAPADWLSLPVRFRDPQAILWDPEGETFLFVFRGEQRLSQMVLDIGFPLRIDRETEMRNVIKSAYAPTEGTLEARLRGGGLELVFGNLP